MSTGSRRTSILEFLQQLANSVSERRDRLVLAQSVLLVSFDDEGGTAVSVTDDVQFTGIERSMHIQKPIIIPSYGFGRLACVFCFLRPPRGI